METVEAEGKTVQAAVEAACAELGISPSDASVEVLQEPREFMGMQTRKARVRVSAPEPAAADLGADRRELGFKRERVGSGAAPDAMEADDEDGSGEPRGRRPILDPNYDPAAALQTICRAIDPNATVSPREEEDRLVLVVHCNGSGLFIGHRGQTLDALQYLINRMAGKQNAAIGRIVVDSENYRERKAARLVDDAWAMAQEVKRRGRPVISEPLSAFDRRIIHTTLREDGRVATRSLGEGEFKRVQVFLNNART